MPGAHPAFFEGQSTFDKGVAYLKYGITIKRKAEKEKKLSPSERAAVRRKRMGKGFYD